MTPASNPRSHRVHMAAAVLAAIAWMFVRHQVYQMDDRFFHPSLAGIEGLALYMAGDYDRAATAYRASLRDDYRTERTANDPAWGVLFRGDAQTAGIIARRALAADPEAIDARLILGTIALDGDNHLEALALFERILSRHPEDVDALLLASVARARSHAYGEAIDLLDRALRNGHIESHITTFLAVLEATGILADLPEAERPPCLLAHYFRYLRIFDDSNGRLAIAYARRAIAVGDRPADAYLTMGIIYEKRGRRDQALQAVLQAIAIDSHHAEALTWAATLYGKRGDLLNEYVMIKKAFETAPTDPFYLRRFHYVLQTKLGDLQQAVEVLDVALQRRPDDVEMLGWLGDLLSSLGEYRTSIATYRRAIDLSPNNPELLEGLGFALDRSGETPEAVRAFEAAARSAPTRAEPHARLAGLYHGQRRYDQAIAEYERAVSLGERDSGRMASLCVLYHLVSRFREAVDCFRVVLDADPKQPLAKRMLPEALTNLTLQQATQ